MKQRHIIQALLMVLLMTQQHYSVTTQGITSFVKPFLNDNKLFAQNFQLLINTFILGDESTVELLKDTVNYSLPLLDADQPDDLFLKLVAPWAFKKLPSIVRSDWFQELGKNFIKEVNADSALFKRPEFVKTVGNKSVPDVGKYLSSLNYPHMFESVNDTDSFVDTVRDLYVNAAPLLSIDDHGAFTQYIVPWAVNNAPKILAIPEIQVILDVLVKEVNEFVYLMAQKHSLVSASRNVGQRRARSIGVTSQSVNVSNLPNLSNLANVSNGPKQPDFGQLLASLNYPRILSGIKDGLFPLNSTDRQLSDQCYSEVMVFFDQLFLLNKDAIDMFDAIGKPTTGINKGVLYFMGSYDECLAVRIHSEVPHDVNATTDDVNNTVDFKGRYCRATFDPPRSLVASIAGEHINNTYGIPLTLSWGMCLPDSCVEGDIEGLLNLGLLGKLFNITVKEAHCSEDQDFVNDTDAHIVVAILGGLLALVVICSILDLILYKPSPMGGILGGLLVLVVICSILDLIFYKPSPTGFGPVSKHYALDNIPMYDNSAFQGHTDKVDDAEYDGGHVESNKDGVKMKNMAGDMAVVESNGYTSPGRVDMMDITMDSDMTRNEDIEEKQGRFVRLIRGFSVFTNIPSLMDTDTKPGDISCLYGIRVVSMAFIVLANTFMYAALSVDEVPVSLNLMDAFNFMDRWTFQPILQASLNTDTFFLISGCLTCYWFMVKSKGLGKKLSGWIWIKFYVGRYWKMTPPYMLTMALFVYLYMYLGQGPVWPDRMPVADKCMTDWWKHLLYISNLIGVDGVPAEDQCMPWSWYIAVNMQLYLIAPIFLSLMVYSSSMGLILILIIGSAGIIATGVKESEYGGDLLTTRTDQGAYWNNVFIKPWCRVAPFCVGMALGFTIFRQRSKQKTMKKWKAAICWICTLLPAAVVLYCQYTKHVDSIKPWTRTQDSVFEALSRPIWAIGVGWIIFASCEGYAGPLGEFFSWRGFVPLSRLTYLVYLLHPIVIVLFTYSKRALNNINDFEMIYLYAGHLLLSYAGAFIACLVIDLPFRNIRRVIQGKMINTPY